VSRRNKRRQNRAAWLLIAGALVIVAAIGAFAWQNAKRADAFDPQTFCPKDGEYPRTAVLLDASDSLSASQTKAVGEYLRDLRARLEEREWLGLFVLRADNLVLPSPEIARCNPGSDANPLYENPRLVRRRFEEEFRRPLEDALSRLAQSENPQDESPILEMVEAVALDRNFDFTRKRRLIIVSDMLQNTAAYSHYRGAPDFAAFRESGYGRRFMELSLLGAEVEILYLKREKTRDLQTTAHIRFWEDFFDAAGARVELVVPIR
jgi:hypothetical protein